MRASPRQLHSIIRSTLAGAQSAGQSFAFALRERLVAAGADLTSRPVLSAAGNGTSVTFAADSSCALPPAELAEALEFLWEIMEAQQALSPADDAALAAGMIAAIPIVRRVRADFSGIQK